MGELEKIQVEKHENRHTFVKINRKYTPKSEQMFVFFHKKLREGACKIGKIWHNVFAFARGRVRPLANAERLEVKKLSFLSGVQDELPVKKGIDNAF